PTRRRRNCPSQAGRRAETGQPCHLSAVCEGRETSPFEAGEASIRYGGAGTEKVARRLENATRSGHLGSGPNDRLTAGKRRAVRRGGRGAAASCRSNPREPSVLVALRSVASLLFGVFLLILGNSLLGILLPVRMGVENLTPEIAGLVMSCYYIGLVLGSLWGKRIIGRVGHIRAFAAFAAGASAATLLHSLWFDPVPWALLRILSGFCMAALFAA